MKRYLIQLCFAALTATFLVSCEGEIGSDEPLDYNTGINVVRFPSSTADAPVVTDGDDKIYNAKIQVAGPTVEQLSGDVTVNFIVVDSLTTAVKGVNYTLDSNQVVLKDANNYLGTIPITVITSGITPPANVTLTLLITDISTSEGSVVLSGNSTQVEIKISYSCFADLTGTYSVTNDFCAPTGLTIEITPNPDGSWHLESADGMWLSECTGNTGLFNAGDIFVVCGEVLPTSNLEFGTSGSGNTYSIGDISGGTWNEATGTLILENSEGVIIPFFNGGPYYWTSTYVRQ